MTKSQQTITESNINYAREYLGKQFINHSWWPTEQPGVARQEYELMQGSVESLRVWCSKWLNPSQIGQLEKFCRTRDHRRAPQPD